MSIKDYFTSGDISEIRYLNRSDIIFDERTRDWCRENRCSKYGSCWTCPPGVGEWPDIKKLLEKYDNAVLFSVVGRVNSVTDLSDALSVGKKSRDILTDIRDKMRDDGFDVLALGGGACDICAECSYPESECRFPEKTVIPIEAYYINVMDTADKFNMIINGGANTVIYFALLFWRM